MEAEREISKLIFDSIIPDRFQVGCRGEGSDTDTLNRVRKRYRLYSATKKSPIWDIFDPKPQVYTSQVLCARKRECPDSI